MRVTTRPRVLLLSLRGPLYKHRTGIFRKSLAYRYYANNLSGVYTCREALL